ncbi:MAG: DegT/DnrJ/EryC1/StrS family aminotransferase [Deltaproteobacteria bacterium]|nr:DegT/DnrJ/EryC1/StrS family aminotransferase [Deltaproteobacteria bacterium]MBW2662080.1 DegT/DnrJ/EryC1/StrS family aminotransferase [Deltaproteobacteria bacterium]
MTVKVPFFNYPALFKMQEKEIMETLHDVMSRGAYILQRDLEEFEENIKELIGVKHVLGVADGTNALMLSLRAAGVGHGDEVIMSSHTYIATAASAHFVGAKPVLVECGADHMIDPESVEKAITDKTRVIMPTQLNGRTCDMDALQAIADNHGLIIIEDAAQALSSKFKGKYAGTFGIAGTFSFYPAKLLGCFGDGGAVVTDDDEVAQKLFLLRDHGRNKEGEVVAWGTNCRLDNIQAAILNLKLKTFDKDITRRREIASIYHHALKGIADLTLPPAPDENERHFDVYQNYELESGHRDDLRDFLEEHGVRTIIQWAGKAVHQFKGLGFDNIKLPVTEKMTSRFLMLPMHTALSDEDVEYVCDCVKDFYSADYTD